MCGLRETDSSGVDVVHVMDRGVVWLLCDRLFVLQNLWDGLHWGWLSWFNLPAFSLNTNDIQHKSFVIIKVTTTYQLHRKEEHVTRDEVYINISSDKYGEKQ